MVNMFHSSGLHEELSSSNIRVYGRSALHSPGLRVSGSLGIYRIDASTLTDCLYRVHNVETEGEHAGLELICLQYNKNKHNK